MSDMIRTDKTEIDTAGIEMILDESLREEDAYCRKSIGRLTRLGLERVESLVLLAGHKSRVKYGYNISTDTFARIVALAEGGEDGASLRRLIGSPFLLVKASWLYEHAPYFFLCSGERSNDPDSVLIKFAEHYESEFLNRRTAIGEWQRMEDPRRIMVTTFWESKIFDPVLLVEKVMRENITGFEYNVDFHPFNYTTLLPEELSPEKRQEIKEACTRSGVKMDIHSPIVGPYTPSPDPSKGKQRFFDPAKCLQIQHETINLAKEIGAGSVVVHLINTSNLKPLVELIEAAGGSPVRVTIENYPWTAKRQTSEVFVSCLNEILNRLPRELRKSNFGVTLDVGHLNIDGEDPIVGAERVGRWCLDHGVFLRVHATDNYGDLLSAPPAYSADVHGNVSGRGINNGAIVKMLRSMGHEFDVVAEQIHPLTPEDVKTIHGSQLCPLDVSFETYVDRGKERLAAEELGEFVKKDVARERGYQFLAGLESVTALREYLVYRRIQNKKHLSVEEAKKISKDFMKMPEKLKTDLTTYIDDLLLPVRTETGAMQKSELDLICQNISGALFATLNNEHLSRIFSEERTYRSGDTVCHQGTLGREMYYIKQGEVAVFLDDACVATLGSGEIFGEISLFYNVNRSATIRATGGGAKVGILSRKGLENLFRGGQPYARDLIYRLYHILPERLRNLNNKYKSAIRVLYLILGGEDSEMPSLDIELEMKRRKSDFVPTLSEDDAKTMSQDIRRFEAGQVICVEGERGEGAYFILEGKVRAVASSKNIEEEIVLGELGPGEMFGEMALVDEKPRSATVVAAEPSKMVFFGKRDFDGLMETRSGLTFRLMGFICLSLFRRILRLDELYSDIHKKCREPKSRGG